MRHFSILVCAVFATTGCSAAKSAMGVLSPKPQPVTVVNNVSVAPAPRVEPTVVVVEKKEKRRSFFEKVGIVTTSTVVGAGLGALAGDALDANTFTTAGFGAMMGAATGLVIVDD